MKLPGETDVLIVGAWVQQPDGSVVGDANCDWIHWLTESGFELVAVENWRGLYRNPQDRRFWELTYPHGGWHGGGPRKLERISESLARERYDFAQP